MTKEQALKRAAHICSVKRVPATGESVLSIAKFLLASGKAGETALLKSIKVAKVKGVTIDAEEALDLANFLL